MLPVRRSFGEWLAVSATLLILVGLLAASGGLGRFDNILYDLSLRQAGRAAPSDIVIVGINDRSLAQIGRWPWRRALHAELVRRLTGARAIAFDVMFTESDRQYPGDDTAFGQAIGHQGNVVLPVLNEPQGRNFAEILPVAPLATGTAGFGHIERESDADGIVRRAHLWIRSSPQTMRPHLALALLGLTDPARYRSYQAADTAVLIPYAGPPGHFRQYSYVDVLTGRIPADVWRDKIVFVGATATGLSDNVPTPVGQSPFDMPGVEVHANLFDGLRSGQLPRALSVGVTGLISLLSLMALLVLLLVSSPQRGLVATAAHALLWLASPTLLLVFGGLWLPPGAALLGTLLAYPLWSWRRLAAAQRWMDAEVADLANAPGLADRRRGHALTDPFAQRIDQIRLAGAQLRCAREDREQALQFLSHDLRSPLAAMLTLLDGADDERSRQLTRHADNALELADDFTQLARAEALDQRHFTELDLAQIMDDAIDAVWQRATNHSIRIDRTGITDDAAALGDAGLLQRTFVNLLDNAIRYSPDHTRITADLAPDEANWKVTIADQGYGIAAADLPHLFERFRRFRLPDQPPIPGNGLGLAMVRTTVEKHGGKIVAESVPGNGTSFYLYIPKI
jgi:CHASE2 domain-containing sensor protein